jgi:hypothetical protein
MLNLPEKLLNQFFYQTIFQVLELTNRHHKTLIKTFLREEYGIMRKYLGRFFFREGNHLRGFI